MDLIPAIDLMNGKCVRLFKGDFNKRKDFTKEPHEQAKFWSSDVNLSDKDSAIKLGAIINIDFFEINSKARFLISSTKLTNNYCKHQP